jgi:hypothetical protein
MQRGLFRYPRIICRDRSPLRRIPTLTFWFVFSFPSLSRPPRNSKFKVRFYFSVRQAHAHTVQYIKNPPTPFCKEAKASSMFDRFGSATTDWASPPPVCSRVLHHQDPVATNQSRGYAPVFLYAPPSTMFRGWVMGHHFHAISIKTNIKIVTAV